MAHTYEHQINNIVDQIESFLNSPLRNTWLDNDIIKVYVRKGSHIVEGKTNKFLDIANIQIEVQSKGTYTLMLSKIMQRFPTQNIFVESIMDERFLNFHTKQGFKVQYVNNDSTNCVYILKTPATWRQLK